MIIETICTYLFEMFQRLMVGNMQYFATRSFAYRKCILMKHQQLGAVNINRRVQNVVGFLDGCRTNVTRRTGERNIPGPNNPDVMYSGKTRTHCVNMMCIQWPDGLTQISPICTGSTHDQVIYDDYGMRNQVMHWLGHYHNPCGFDAVLYGDKAFAAETNVAPAFKLYDGDDHVWRAHKEEENAMMLRPRLAVEQGFAIYKQRCKYIAMDMLNHTKEHAFGERMTIAYLLCNMSACLYVSQVSTYFKCKPPPLEEYMGL